MALKPLKNHRYLSEDEAAEMLSSRIGEAVSAEEMARYALKGVVPAYMQYQPRNQELYPATHFELIRLSELSSLAGSPLSVIHSERYLKTLPFPLPDDGIVTDSRGEYWRVFAGRSDRGLDEVSAEHYVRVYAPRELARAAKVINDPSNTSWPTVAHSSGETWEIERDEYNDGEVVSILSPFLDEASPGDSDNKEGMLLAIAGLLDLLTSDGRRKYTQGEVAKEIGDRHRNWYGAGERTLNGLFAKANKIGLDRDKAGQ